MKSRRKRIRGRKRSFLGGKEKPSGTFSVHIHLMLDWGSSGRLEQYMHQHDNIPGG